MHPRYSVNEEAVMTRPRHFRAIAGALILVGTILAASGGPASAQGWGHGGGHEGGLRLGVPLRALNLTPDQQAQVQTIVASSRATARPIAQQLRQAEGALADALVAAPGADVSAQLTTINGLRAQLLQNRVQTTAQVLGVLRPDQLTRAAQVRAQLKQLRSQMRQLMEPAQP